MRKLCTEMPRPSLCARAQFYCTYVVCTLCITTDIRIITVYKDNSSQIKSSKTAAFAKPAIREKLIGGGAALGMLGQAWLRRHYLRRRAASGTYSRPRISVLHTYVLRMYMQICWLFVAVVKLCLAVRWLIFRNTEQNFVAHVCNSLRFCDGTYA